MKIPLIYHAFQLASRWIDDTISVEDLHVFMLEKTTALIRHLEAQGAGSVAPAVSVDLRYILETASDLSFMQERLYHLTGAAGNFSAALSEALPEGLERWRAMLPHGRVISKGSLVAQTGRFLDYLDSQEATRGTDFVKDNLERLRRHVEIKRNRSLETLTPPVPQDRMWLERHDIAILFARHSLRSRDLRMLNAALKLNDWAFPVYKSMPVGPSLSRYLVALFEQEKSARELLHR